MDLAIPTESVPEDDREGVARRRAEALFSSVSLKPKHHDTWCARGPRRFRGESLDRDWDDACKELLRRCTAEKGVKMHDSYRVFTSVRHRYEEDPRSFTQLQTKWGH